MTPKKNPNGKISSEVSAPKAKAPKAKAPKALVPCETCQGTGLKFDDIRYKSHATEMCSVCSGSGKVEK